MEIFYLIDMKAKKFYFFQNGQYNEAKEKQQEFTEKYGMKHVKLPTGYEFDTEPIQLQFKTLKHYYGTVWLAYFWTDTGAVHYKIEGRWKDLKRYQNDKKYTIKKFIIVPYDEYMKQFKDDDDDDELSEKEKEFALKAAREMIE